MKAIQQWGRPLLISVFAILLGGCKNGNQIQAQGAASTLSARDITQRTIERRAVEAVIWGTPAVNFDRMYQAMVHDAKAGEGSNKIVYWSRLFDWKNQTLTQTPTPSTSWPSSTPRMSVRSCLKYHLRTEARSLAKWTIAGRPPLRTWDQRESTRAREARPDDIVEMK